MCIMYCKMFFYYIISLCLTLTLGDPLHEESTQSKSAVERIIGGQAAYAGQFPFVAAVTINTENGVYFCGGALLTSLWVVTAGHCVDGGLQFIIQLGSYNLDANDPNLVRLSTDEYVLHPEYDPNTLANDIGLIQFRLKVTYSDYIKPVQLLPAIPLYDNSNVRTMGWGEVSDEDSGLQDGIYWVTVTTISNTECKLYYGNQVLDNMVCAEGNFNEGTCFGDTGGPLIQYAGRGQVVLVGVASFISQNGCESTDPSGYTRTFDYVAWLKNTTGFV